MLSTLVASTFGFGPAVEHVSAASGHAAATTSPAERPTRRIPADGRQRLDRLVALLERARKEPVEGAEELGREALALLEASPDASTEIRVRLALSWHASRSGDMAAGLEHAERVRLADRFGVALGHRLVAREQGAVEVQRDQLDVGHSGSGSRRRGPAR